MTVIELPTHKLMTHPLQLVGPVGPLAQLSLVSQHLTFAYTIENINVHFPLGAGNLVRVYLFLSLDPSSPTTGLPAGTPLLTWLSPNPYLLGDDCVITLPMSYNVLPRGTWLKAHIVNTDAFAHTISALLSIKELEAP